MRFLKFLAFAALPALAFTSGFARAEVLAPEKQALVDAKVTEIKTWAADPVIVKAVVAQNTALPAALADMTQDKWKALTLLDPFVRSFTKNDVGVALKARKAPWVSEAFVNDAKGLKVGFLAKTTGWSHAGKDKHAKPMAGATWQGAVELDESTGLQQVQVSVPVLSDGQPVGSLVVGVSLSSLE